MEAGIGTGLPLCRRIPVSSTPQTSLSRYSVLGTGYAACGSRVSVRGFRPLHPILLNLRILIHRYVQRFRGGLVFKTHRLCVSLKYRLESDTENRERFEPPHPTQGPSWGYLKVNFSETLSIFGDKCPRNGSKNEQTAPRTSMGYPHIGPSVVVAARTPCGLTPHGVTKETIKLLLGCLQGGRRMVQTWRGRQRRPRPQRQTAFVGRTYISIYVSIYTYSCVYISMHISYALTLTGLGL